MLRLFYVQTRKIEKDSVWSPKSSAYKTLQGAKSHVEGMEKLAERDNYLIEHVIVDEAGAQIEHGRQKSI